MLALLMVCSNLYALAVAWGALRVLRDVPMLRDVSPLDSALCPSVSVLVPACNEGFTIAAATEKRLELDYPNLHVPAANSTVRRRPSSRTREQERQ